MASELDHIALANRNHDALGEHAEWVATIAFYKALQVVEACFAHKGLGHAHGHAKRLEILHVRRNGFQSFCRHYEALLEASEVARYLGCRSAGFSGSSFASYMDMHDVIDDLLKKRLMNIEMHARQFLCDQAKAQLKQVMSLFTGQTEG